MKNPGIHGRKSARVNQVKTAATEDGIHFHTQNNESTQKYFYLGIESIGMYTKTTEKKVTCLLRKLRRFSSLEHLHELKVPKST